MPVREPSLRARTLALAAACVLAACSTACSKKDESNLAQMAEDGDEPKAPGLEVTPADTGPEPTPLGGTEPTPAPDPDVPVDANGIPIPPQDGDAKLLTPGADERVQLRLALAEGAHYRMTTLGMLKLPLLQSPTGFAREEDLSLSDCKGEGAARTCLVTHAYRNYEAEPPTGKGLEADELLVAELETSHRIDASGLRISDTSVSGEAAPNIGKQLAEIHRLYCIRLPAEPVGVGATWRDVCRMRQGGALVTRELTWRLAKLEDTADGKRAELEYAGRVRRINPKGELVNGEIQGSLFFWVDAGEPHLMRERLVFVLNAEKGMSTSTDYRYQFAKLGDDDELLRTDGKAFEHSPRVLNDPRSVPAGTTRDGELPAEDGPK